MTVRGKLQLILEWPFATGLRLALIYILYLHKRHDVNSSEHENRFSLNERILAPYPLVFIIYFELTIKLKLLAITMLNI